MVTKSLKKNHVAIVIDRSGSMGHLRKQVVDLYNSTIRNIKDKAKLNNQPTLVSLVTFANDVHNVIWTVDSQEVKEWSFYDYSPAGGTALLEGFGKTVERLGDSEVVDRNKAKRWKKKFDTSFLVITITDGDENSSNPPYVTNLSGRTASYYEARNTDYIKRMIADKNSLGNWTFVFNVPDKAGRTFLENFGIPSGNINIWEQTTQGVREVEQLTSGGIESYYQGRSKGLTSVRNFYK